MASPDAENRAPGDCTPWLLYVSSARATGIYTYAVASRGGGNHIREE